MSPQLCRRAVHLAFAFAGVLLCDAALAIDGVVLIDQNKALAGGVTPGDTPGFPVTISQPGSYRLTSNLVVPDENTDGIYITTNDVSIDLNGFSISGPGRPSAAPTFRGFGILAVASSGLYASIRNGSIFNMGSAGIVAFTNTIIHNMRIHNNGGDGIQTVGNVFDNVIVNNKRGMVLGIGSVARNNLVKGVGDGGTIFADCAVLLVGNLAETIVAPYLTFTGPCVRADNNPAP